MYHQAQAYMSPETIKRRWREQWRDHPRTVVALLSCIALALAADAFLGLRYLRYLREIERLRSGMTEAERQRTDVVVANEANRVSVMLELIRRQAAGDPGLHLSVSIDSGTMLLERDGALLREMRVEVGEERLVGTPPDTLHVVKPRGARSIERVLGAREAWEVPRWVFTDRGLAVPTDRHQAGALGRNALLLTGGTIIYAVPDSGVLADTSYVLPGAVRVTRSDLRAIVPIISPGVTVYFYE